MIRPRRYCPMLAVLCAVSSSFPAAAAGPRSRPKLRVEVCDLAHLTARNLALSTEEAGRLMREVGIDVVWEFPALQAPQRILKIGVTEPWGLSDQGQAFIVRILPTAPKHLPCTLGYSLPAEPDWVHAAIFDNHVEEVHYRNRVAYASLLGCAIAHEVAHLLLKSPEHAVRGVMKARWERRDLLDIACGRLSFNPEEEKPISCAALRWLSKHRRS